MQKQSNLFFRIAYEFAKESKCVSRKVSAIAVRDGRIIATGINGSTPGQPNCCDMHFDKREDHVKWSELNEVHAEMNLIAYCAREGISLKGATVYCTLEPCYKCARDLAMTKISALYAAVPYDRTTPEIRQLTQDRFKNHNIEYIIGHKSADGIMWGNLIKDWDADN